MRATPDDFPRFEQLRAHDYVAEQLRRLIALRLVVAGRSLPPERTLARLFGVGRATVQKAIDQLEAEGLVSRRRGRTGGTFVVERIIADTPGEAVLEALRAHRRLVEEALDYRHAVEPTVAGMAALRHDDQALRGLLEAARLAAAARDDAEFMEHDTELHLRIGRASGNRFLAAGVEQLRLVLNDALAALPDSALWHARSAAEHDAIVEAIARRDETAARQAMLVHVAHTDRAVRALLAALTDPA